MNKKKWEIKKLGEVCDFINGFAFKSELFKNTGFPIVRISNIQEEKIDLDEIVCFDKNDYRVNLEKYKVQHKDILIAMSGATTGKVGIYLGTNEIYLNQRVGALRTKKNVNNQFVFYFLKTKVEETLRLALGVAQPNIGSEQIKSYEIPIPPLPIQQSIVSELDSLHRLKELQEQQLAEYDNLAQSTFYSMFGDPIENEKGWEVKKLGEVCNFTQGVQIGIEDQITEKKEGYNRFLRISDYTQDCEIRYVKEDNKKYLVKEDDVVIVRYGASAGFVGINKTGVLANNLFNLKYNTQIINYVFLYYQLKTEHYESFIKKIAFGAAMPALSFNTFKDFQIVIPPLSLQTHFSERIEKIEAQKALIKQSIGETQLLIDYTMDKYFG